MQKQPDPLLTMRVDRKTIEADGIASFTLSQAKSGTLPCVEAGAHIDVHLKDGKVRQYSLYNAPGQTTEYQIAVLRDSSGRGGSIEMHDQVTEGAVLQISSPRNSFPLLEDAPATILFAGGIGITPILSMAKRLHTIGAPFALHYCTRAPEKTAFRKFLLDSEFAEVVWLHHDDGPQNQKLDLEACLRAAPHGAHLYVCGPSGFMNFILSGAKAQGWGEERLHSEFFSPRSGNTSDASAFDVVIKSTGATIHVPQDQSVVSVLAEHGIAIPTSCEVGVCGTCLTGVLDGVPDHRDQFLTPQEREQNRQFMPCCSRAKTSQLVLNL